MHALYSTYRYHPVETLITDKMLKDQGSLARVCEFAGVERWNGTVEWTTGVEYWSATPTNRRFAAVASTLNATQRKIY